MVERDQILTFLKSKGPSVPNDMKKALGGDTIIFGAMLSELISRGQVFITKVKKGSSPFYYVAGQEKQLEKLIEFCNPKDQKTITLLKNKKVLRDQTLELFERVSLRQVPDYAKELKVSTAQGVMFFWRYYLVSEEDAISALKEQYNKVSEKTTTIQTRSVPSQIKKVSSLSGKKIEQQAKTSFSPPITQNIKKEIPQLPREESKKENQQQLSYPRSLDKCEFYSLILNYFASAQIQIVSQEQIAKNREYEFVVIVPSALGSMKMYARARNKKKLNEGDVAPALLKAKMKDLPCIFLTTGDFSKKSLLLIEKEYKGLIIKKI